MEKLNSIASLIVSTCTIIGFIFGFLLYFYKQTLDRIEAVASDVKDAQSSINTIEKDMLKGSDSRIKTLVENVERRLEDVDETHLKKHRELKKQIDFIRENLDDAKEAIINQLRKNSPIEPEKTGKVIDLDKQKIAGPNSLEERVIALEQRDIVNKSLISALRKAVSAHQEWLKELMHKKKD